MNKTVLLACCDFLILASLALTPFNFSSSLTAPGDLLPSSQFHITETEKSSDKLLKDIYESRIDELTQKLQDSRDTIEAQNKKLVDKSLLLETKDSELQKLRVLFNRDTTSAFQTIVENRWQINVSMKEDDSFRPDFFSKSFFSCSFVLNDRVFLVAEFDNLGFQWSELINDGNISKLAITLAKTGSNPWSIAFKGPLFSMNQDPALCLLEVPKDRVHQPIKVLPYARLVTSIEKIYAAKSDGRVIKIKNASIIPNEPDWLVIDEERFLGHPDKVQKGDLLITEHGLLVGAITQKKSVGNVNRLKALILDRLDFSEKDEMSLKKSSGSKYFTEFVKKAQKISGLISTKAQ